jgi:hypothetical protein
MSEGLGQSTSHHCMHKKLHFSAQMYVAGLTYGSANVIWYNLLVLDWGVLRWQPSVAGQ